MIEKFKNAQFPDWETYSDPDEEDVYLVAIVPTGKSNIPYPHFYALANFEDGEWNVTMPEKPAYKEVEVIGWMPLPPFLKED